MYEYGVNIKKINKPYLCIQLNINIILSFLRLQIYLNIRAVQIVNNINVILKKAAGNGVLLQII